MGGDTCVSVFEKNSRMKNTSCCHCFSNGTLEYDFEYGGGNLCCTMCGFYSTPIDDQMEISYDGTPSKMIHVSKCDPISLYKEIIKLLNDEQLVACSDLENFHASFFGNGQSTVDEDENINLLMKGSVTRSKAVLLYYIFAYLDKKSIDIDINRACKILNIEYTLFSQLMKKSGRSFIVGPKKESKERFKTMQISIEFVKEKLQQIKIANPKIFSNDKLDLLAKNIYIFYKNLNLQETEKNKLCYAMYAIFQKESVTISKVEMCKLTDLSNAPTLSKIIKRIST